MHNDRHCLHEERDVLSSIRSNYLHLTLSDGLELVAREVIEHDPALSRSDRKDYLYNSLSLAILKTVREWTAERKKNNV